MASVVKKGHCYYLVFTVAGKQKWESLPKGTNKKEALVLKAEREVQINRKQYSDKRIVFNELADKWLDTQTAKVKAGERKYSTVEGYQAINDVHLKPFFGDMQVLDITVSDIEDYIVQKQATKLSNRSIGYQVAQLSRMLKKAVVWSYCYQNVALYVERPSPEHKEVKILSSEEIDRLLTTATGQDRLIVLTGILTGVRAGELVALNWGRVDLVDAVIDISGPRANYVRGRFEQPKAKGSIRQVVIPPNLVGALAGHKPDDASDDDLVFSNGAGHPIAWASWLHRSWHPLIDAAKVPKVKFHSLRHNYVSVLRAAKYDWPIIQRLVGHRDLSTTQNIYTHMLPGQEVGAGQKIQDAFKEYVK